MGLRDFTIYSIIKRNARTLSNNLGWICGDVKLTYKEYCEGVDRLASGLLSMGLKKGDRIGVLSKNNLEFAYLYGVAAKTGAIMLPINWRLKREEVEYCISDGAPKFLFVEEEFQEMISGFMAKFDFVQKYFSMGPAQGDFAPFHSLMVEDDQASFQDVQTDDAFVIFHTAAVAGKPRGATLTHEGILFFNFQNLIYWKVTEKDCHLLVLPLFHLTALGVALAVMHAGGTNVILPKFDPDNALKHIQENKVSIFAGFPPMLSTLLERNKELKYDLTSLRIITGLDNLETIKEIEEITDGRYWTAYGQSETSGLITFAPFFDKPGSAGKPCFAAEVEIMDEHGKFVESGQTGEIVVRGPMVFQGYWNLSKENEYTSRYGWHHTGDMGRFDEDGYLWYMGRMGEKELIKSGGENVYPAEVERVILDHPLVQEVSVIGVPDKQWGEAIKAVCVLKKDAILDEKELIEFVAARIARFKKPKYVVFVPNLPKTKDGLIDKERVRAQYG